MAASETHAFHSTPANRVKPSSQKGQLHVEPTPRYYRVFLSPTPHIDQAGVEPFLESSTAFLVWEGESKLPRLAFLKKNVKFTKEGESSTTGLVPTTSSFAKADSPSPLAKELYRLQLGNDASDYLGHGDRKDAEETCQKIVAWSFEMSLPFTQSTARDVPAPDSLIVLDTTAFPSVWEEDEPILGHVKDPFHRVDITPTKRNVEVYALKSSHQAILIADSKKCTDSQRVIALFETGFPTRWYMPRTTIVARSDEDPSSLPSSSTVYMRPPPACDESRYPSEGLQTVCPYKGIARYHSIELPGGETLENIAWSYPTAIRALDIRGLVCFWTPGNERLKIVVDGQEIHS